MSRKRELGTIIFFCVAAILYAAVVSPTAPFARSGQGQSSGQTDTPPASSDFQRAAEIYAMKTSAQSGWQRGEEIYYYKCWVCHNRYTKSAPLLKDLYQRSTLASGQTVSDESVSGKIRSGGPGMPAYRHTMTPADMTDLLDYFKSGKCCFEGEEPPRNPRYRGGAASSPEAPQRRRLAGGATGLVRSAAGEPREGIMVQLISHRSAVRTTVYTSDAGRYEFPKLEPGQYVLRIARPLEFRPYARDSVRIDGPTKLADIVLQRVAATELLPPTPEIAAQLTGAEWLMNLPGTGEEKRQFIHSCNWCHSYQQIFKTRYDESGWRLIVDRMMAGAGSPLIVLRPQNQLRETPEQKEKVIRWLAAARGPASQDAPFHVFPGPRGPATRVIVTEYELPRTLLATHDICGDSKGNIWYTPHRSPYVGVLDPRTGIVKEYRVPPTPGALPGTHSVWVDKNDLVWLSENWAHNLTKFDPRTEKFTQIFLETGSAVNAPGFGNFALAHDGSIWYTWDGAVVKIDPDTGKVLKRYPFQTIRTTYDNLISMDGNFWAGGQWPGNLVGLLDIRLGRLWEIPTRTPMSSPAKGAFDREGNAWFGGRAGALIKLDTRTRQTREYLSPTPHVSLYEAMPDKNGEIWAGELHGGRFARFNPRTERWVNYVLPEPYAHDRRTWIDNSTDPVTVWYADHEGYMVRLQPLE